MHRSPPHDDVGPEPSDEVLAAAMGSAQPADAVRPGGKSPSRRRNQACIIIIALGLLNLVAYTFAYAVLGGDAHNGHREITRAADGSEVANYYLRGHFIHSLTGRERAVSRATWIYSYIHSITIPLTSGAMIISMLVLARPHIIATMRGGLISGRTFIVAFGTIVACITGGTTALFLWHFIDELSKG